VGSLIEPPTESAAWGDGVTADQDRAMPYATNPIDQVRTYFEDSEGRGQPVLVYPGFAEFIEAAIAESQRQGIDYPGRRPRPRAGETLLAGLIVEERDLRVLVLVLPETGCRLTI
jgi:hypothetical protein